MKGEAVWKCEYIYSKNKINRKNRQHPAEKMVEL